MSHQSSQRTASSLARIDVATETLVSKFSEIVSLATNAGKDKTIISAESFQIEANASSIVRAAEDLLSLTRSLKEAWILGQIRPQPNHEDIEDEKAYEQQHAAKIQQVLDSILSNPS